VTTSNRWLIGIGVALGALVVLAFVVAFVSANDEATYPEDTPEGVVQRYLAAIAADDLTAAYDYLSPELQAECSLTEWRQQGRYLSEQVNGAQITLRDVEMLAEDEAEVTITVTMYGEPGLFPIPPPENSWDQAFYLERQSSGVWTFSESPWPAYCRTPVPVDRPTPTPTPTPTPIASPTAEVTA
jgi:hypothetical protein